MFSTLKTWTTAAGTALFALAAVGCGAYEPEPEVPQYEYAAPPRPLTAEELAQQQAAQAQQAAGEDVAIGEDNADEYNDTDPSALTEFKPVLEQHGNWVEDPTYGTVWVPAKTEVGEDFEPYVTAGHWTYADETDYVWVSDYSWGWAPFHYGRWVNLPNHRWSWIPGRRYSGAWVTWRTGPAGYGYVGWAPAAPSYYWSNGYAVGWSFNSYRYYDHYVYCPHDRFYYGGGVNTYVVRGPAARTHYERTVEYQPQQRVAAAPSVNGGGRIAANPSVGGSQRVAASPAVTRRGPRPEEMGMGRDAIVAPPAQNQNAGIDRARTLAAPSTAVASGARAPIRTASINPRGPATSGMVPSNGSQPAFRPASPSVGGRPSSPSFSSSAPSQPRVAQPSYRSASPSVSSSPSFRPSQPSMVSRPSSSPSVMARPSISPSAPVRSSPSPSFRSSAPSVRSSAPSVMARPSVAPSSPSRGGSIMRSSPSVSAPRASSGGSRSSSVRRR